MKILAKHGKHHEEVKIIKKEGSMLRVTIGNREYTLDVEKVENGVYSVLHKGISHNMEIIKSEKKDIYTVNTQFQTFDIEISSAGPPGLNDKKRRSNVEKMSAPIPGKVISIKVLPGDQVAENQILVILSAMKMENELKSPITGVVTSVNVKEGDVVKEGTVMVEVKSEN